MLEIDAYVGRVERALAFDRKLAERVSAEVSNHLEEAAEHIGPGEAIERFGDVDAIVRAIAAISAANARRTLAAYAAVGVAVLFAVMEVRSTLLARDGTTIFGADDGAPLFVLDAAGFIVAACAMLFVFASFRLPARRALVTVVAYLALESGLATSIACDAAATALHARVRGADTGVAAAAALLEVLIVTAIAVMTSPPVFRAVRAASLASSHSTG